MGRTKRRVLISFTLLAIGCPLGLCGLGAVAYQSLFGGDASRLEEEIEQARREGLPLEPRDLRPATPLPAEQNAATVYRPFFARLERLFKDHPTVRTAARGLVRGNSPTDKERAELMKALDESKESLNQIVAASRRPYCDFEYEYERGFDLLFPELAQFRSAVILLCARAHIDSEMGRLDRAWDTLAAAQRMSRHAGQNPTLIGMLVQISMEAIVVEATAHVLGQSFRNSASLTRAERLLAGFGPIADIRHALRGEIVLGRIAIQRLKNTRDISAAAGESGDGPSLPLPGTVRKAFEVRFLRIWRRIMAEIPKDPQEWAAANRVLERAERDVEADRSVANTVNLILFPVFSQAGNAIGQQEARRRILATALRLLERRSRTGSVPERLPDLGTTSIDPFDGKPLRYRRSGDGFTLYSVGPDLKDDGGNVQAGRFRDVGLTFP